MPDETPTSSRCVMSLNRAAKLNRITGALFSIAALLSAIAHHSSQVAVYLALCAVFLALGASKARQAAKLVSEEKAQSTEAKTIL